MKVCFIVHGNANTGMGHIMRSLSLAAIFKEREYDVCFFSKYKQGIQTIRKNGFEVFELHPGSAWNGEEGFYNGSTEELRTDFEDIRKQMSRKADVLIVDSYNVTKAYFMSIRKLTNCLVYIDDLNSFHYPVDIVINGTASAFDMGYEKTQTARLLLGMKYTQIRKEFYNVNQREIYGNIQNVLITTGNADPYHMTEDLLNILTHTRQFWGLRYHVIVGGGFDDSIWLNRSIINNKQICIYDKPGNMAEIMLKCDLAIVAGGSTLYELMACGVPAMAFAYADNQLPHIKALERKGLLQYIGYYNNLDEQELVGGIKYLMDNLNMRKKLVERLQLIVDGNGCQRIVKAIEEYVS